MEDEFSEEFESLRQDYNGLSYPGDVPGDLGLVPARPIVRRDWQIGPITSSRLTSRWLGWTAAAAAVALVTGGIWHAVAVYGPNPTVLSPVTVAMTPATQPTAVASGASTATTPKEITPKVMTPKATTPTEIASNTKSSDSSKKSDAADDSIPLWSDVNSPTLSTAAAGMPSESLIIPTLSDAQDAQGAADRVKNSQSKS